LEVDVLLAVDTSTQWISLALYDGAQVLGETTWRASNHHTVELSPAIADLLQHCGIKPQDLKALGVALGPGAFTSLRIGLAVAKGLALAVHVPVAGIPTLDILAAAQPRCDLPMLAMLQVGRSRLAVGKYKSSPSGWVADGEPELLTVEDLARQIRVPTLVCGELTAEERQILARKRKNVVLVSPAQSLRRAAFLAELAWKRIQTGQIDDVVSLSPVYLHTAAAIPD
jgi:tRNA threonylcarbamoyladenosine biosynthesis protein TsaB